MATPSPQLFTSHHWPAVGFGIPKSTGEGDRRGAGIEGCQLFTLPRTQNKTNLLSSTLTDVSIILKRANDWKSCVPRQAWFPRAESVSLWAETVSLRASAQPRYPAPVQPCHRPRCCAAQVSVSQAGTGKGTVWAPESLTPHLSHQQVI